MKNGSTTYNRRLHFGIPHVSCYALTVEPGTALDSMIKKHKTHRCKYRDQARQFLLLMDWLQEAGYEHYEISNFAMPGMRSRHNSSYWQGASYLGLGPSAHSFNGSFAAMECFEQCAVYTFAK